MKQKNPLIKRLLLITSLFLFGCSTIQPEQIKLKKIKKNGAIQKVEFVAKQYEVELYDPKGIKTVIKKEYDYRIQFIRKIEF